MVSVPKEVVLKTLFNIVQQEHRESEHYTPEGQVTINYNYLNPLRSVEEFSSTRFLDKCGYHGNALSDTLKNHVKHIYISRKSCVQNFMWIA